MLDISLKQVQAMSFGFLLALTGGSWLIMSWSFAQFVLVGGILAVASFYSGHRDIAAFLKSFQPPPEDAEEADTEEEPKKKGGIKSKAGYIIKFWLRLALIGVVLWFVVRKTETMKDIIALLLGLSTVVFAIMLTTVSVAGRYFLSRKE